MKLIDKINNLKSELEEYKDKIDKILSDIEYSTNHTKDLIDGYTDLITDLRKVVNQLGNEFNKLKNDYETFKKNIEKKWWYNLFS